MRDRQRARAYRAERAVWDRDVLIGGDIEGVRRFVRRVMKSRTWALLGGPGELEVRPGRENQHARGGRFSITIPPWARRKIVVLHELAHTLCPGGAHDWAWANTFLVLVGRFMGADVRRALKLAFQANRVRHRPPRKLSPERREELRRQGRLLAARPRDERGRIL